MTTIAFLHTSPQHIATFDALVADAAPDAKTLHRVENQLLTQARLAGAEAVADEVGEILQDLADEGADVIVCTSPAIAGVAEREGASVPVLRVDRPVARDAVASAHRIGVVSALASALVPTMHLLKEEAKAAGTEIEIVPVIVAGAWLEFEAGEEEVYAEAVAKATIDLAQRTDLVVLAQASLMGAVKHLPEGTHALVSPPLAVAEALELANSQG